jgi:hypothetical protein
LLYLSCFDFSLHHRAGKTMGKPDTLSRCADHSLGQSDNDNMMLLTPDLFHIHALSAINIVGPEKEILTDI